MLNARHGAAARASRSRRLLLGASAAALLSAGAAAAQPTPPTAPQDRGPSTNNAPTDKVSSSGNPSAEQRPSETPAGADVVVTGFRSSLRNAIQTKRSSDQIIESISAEDIGKLPDNSIAESIARLPGITAQRLNGRDSVISIRGLAPDFTTTLLNGREQVSTGDNRSAEFDQYPSELISGVVVYKTPEAGLVGQGLAGTVDLRTIRPLDYHQRVLSFNARGEYQTLDSRDDNGYRVSGTYIDQFLDGKLGVSFGIAHEESPNLQTRENDYGFATLANGLLVPGGIVTEAYEGDLKRTGAALTLQYKPNSHFTNTVDVYYSDYENTLTYHGLEQGLAYGGGPSGGPGPTLEPGYSSDGKFVTQGVYDNIYTVQRNDLNRRQADLLSIGYNAAWTEGPWKLIGDVSYSGVRRRDNLGETYSGTGRNFAGTPDTVGFNLADDGHISLTEMADHADTSRIFLTSPQGWGSDVVPGGQDGYLNSPLVRDELLAYRASVTRELDNTFLIKSVELGGNFTHRFKSYTPDEYFLGLNANLADPTHTTSVPFPAGVLNDPVSLGFAGLGDVVSADPQALFASGVYSFLRNPNSDVLTKGWKVKEDVSTAWFKTNLNQDIGPGTLTGNAGVQLVFTDQQSTGFVASGSPIFSRSALQDGAYYIEPLPSLNLSYRMPELNDVVRFGVARELARARMDQLSASINFSYNADLVTSTDLNRSPFGGGGGNARLRPWIADSLDLSVEHYFGRDGYVSLAAYYKYLETYIYTQNALFDFSQYPLAPGQSPLLRQGIISTPQNGAGGNLYGLEFTVVTPIATLLQLGDRFGWRADMPFLDGFGLSGSASWTDSEVQPGGPGTHGPLPGLSKWVGNGTAYYEKYGVSARVSVRYRSKFLGEVSGFGDSRTYNEGAPETIVDAQVGYTFDHGRLKGLGILLQGNNLTDEPFTTYEAGDPRRILSDQEYGRRILFGVSYKY